MNYDRDNLPVRLADEYVFGTLTGKARQRFERLSRERDTFRRARRDAENRWNVLAESLPPMDPSPAVWRGVRQRINPSSEKASTGTTFWRRWALAASLALAAVLVYPLVGTEGAHDYVVVITHDTDATAGWLISLQDGMATVRVESLASHSLPEDRVYQLWVKAPDRPRVESVGVIRPTGEIALQAGPELQAVLSRAVLFGVSVEPLGGSPTGQPTTTPLFHGKPRSI